MKTKIVYVLIGLCSVFDLSAQEGFNKNYRNFPIVFTIQFQSLSMPFRNLKANFRNIGFGIGTEVSFNGKHNWVQQFNVMWYRNKTVGNGLFFYTQSVWRPTVKANIFTELKLGIGYLLAFRPVPAYRPEKDKWIPVGRRGKGLLVVPLGISLGYHKFSDHTYLAPFTSYQFLAIKGYNKSMPVIPNTLLQMGTRVHLD